MERRDQEIWGAWGQIVALEVAITALLRSHPDAAALQKAWRDAEDVGFTWTSDLDPQVGDARGTLLQTEYRAMLDRLRKAAGL